jgi:hypothetical protein
MSESPNVIVRVGYYLPGSGSARDFYSSKDSSGDYLRYVDSGARAPDYLGYADNPCKTSGAFSQNGLLSPEDRQVLRAKLRSTKSVIWDMVISFEGKFGEENMRSWEDAKELVSAELPGFLKENRLSYANVTYFAALHKGTTDNPHIHLCFFENEPSRVVKDRKGLYWHRGKISLLSMTNFRVHIEERLTSREYKLSSYRRRLMDDCDDSLNKLSEYEKHDRELRGRLLRLQEILPQGKSDYAGKSVDNIRPFIDETVSFMIHSNPEMEAEFRKLMTAAGIHDAEIKKICERDKADPTPFLMAEKLQRDLYRRWGNKLIEFVNDARRSDIKTGRAIARERRMRWREKAIKDSLIHHTASLEKRCDEEAADCLDDFERRLKKAEHDRLVEEGEIEPDK